MQVSASIFTVRHYLGIYFRVFCVWFVVPLFRHLVPFFRDNMQDLKSFHLSVVCPRYDLILDWVLWVM